MSLFLHCKTARGQRVPFPACPLAANVHSPHLDVSRDCRSGGSFGVWKKLGAGSPPAHRAKLPLGRIAGHSFSFIYFPPASRVFFSIPPLAAYRLPPFSVPLLATHARTLAQNWLDENNSGAVSCSHANSRSEKRNAAHAGLVYTHDAHNSGARVYVHALWWRPSQWWTSFGLEAREI